MKKCLLFIIILSAVFLFASCKENNAIKENDTVVSEHSDLEDKIEIKDEKIDLVVLRETIISKTDAKDPILVETSRLKSLYGIDEEMVIQSANFVTMTGVFPAEIVMLEAKDNASAEIIAELLNNRLKEVKNQSKSYDPENYKLAQQCSVDVEGSFVSMFLAPNHEEMKNIYNSFIK